MRVCLRRTSMLWLLTACLLGLCGTATRTTAFSASFAGAAGSEQEEKGSGRELFYKCVNFALLAGALAYFLRKPLASFLADRSASIRRSLEEGIKALRNSQTQIETVEEKLRRLEGEIAALKASAAEEMEAERLRLQKAADDEAERILQAARAQTEAAIRAAKLELKSYAADQAVQLAEEIVRQRLDEAGKEKLVSQFIEKLESKARQN